MKCPNDNATLLITERSGIEIDYCPDCRGVWLDRGELDKIIDRGAQPQPPVQPMNPSRPETPPHYPQNDYNNPHHKKRRKESFLGDLFDF
jgi:Zn-finger nucleic acid-binding protein